ncbi:hypothetical protein BC831DRAFT_434787 [Entophlyctis helioformis]|nr:hypothetical protein BC831DRAFT_434787 [Entophlyctis helioformis]
MAIFLNIYLIPLLALGGAGAFAGVAISGSVMTKKDSQLTLHIAGMSGFVFISSAAILLNQTPSESAHARKLLGVLQHWRMQCAAILSATVGFIFIFRMKTTLKAAHFVSNHAIVGLVTLCLVCTAAIVAALLRFCPEFFGGQAAARRLLKIHRAIGYTASAFMYAAALLAAQTKAASLGVRHPMLLTIFISWTMFWVYARLRYLRYIKIKTFAKILPKSSKSVV